MKRTFILITLTFIFFSCKTDRVKTSKEKDAQVITLQTNSLGEGREIELEFIKGKSQHYPLMALWVENMEGNYIQTLYVAESIAKGVFGHGDASTGKWMPGPVRRPAALPYWGHQRGIKAPDGIYLPTQETPVPDAYTGATPTTNFVLTTRTDQPVSSQVRILFEINQAWDWNDFWTNNKFPLEEPYKTSGQPALVYAATVDLNEPGEYEMKPIGHSHYAGKDGNLYTDLSTFTTALNIVEKLIVRVK
jgi:hypothetical protein